MNNGHSGARPPGTPLLIFVLICVNLWLPVPLFAAETVDKGIRVAPVAATAPGGNAGLFVGVNQFNKDTSLQPLRFAVNDAIAQAHLFVVELKLVSAANCYLALAGTPSTESAKVQLADLEKAGVRKVEANKTDVLMSLATVARVPADAGDMVVVSISSHGFEDRNVAYAMPADGARGFLEDTAINLGSIEQRLASSKAGKRLLLVDACRERASSDTKGGDTPMSGAFRAALAAAEGQAVLASCDAGQLSIENPDLGHGVFTYFLLEALHGKAAPDDRGFITLRSVSDYVAGAVRDYVVRSKPGLELSKAQSPWFKGPKVAEQIPLAVDPGIRDKQEAFKAEVAKVIDALKTKIDRKGLFNAAIYEKLANLLDTLDPTDALDRELFGTTKEFADGKIRESVFVPFLEKQLADGVDSAALRRWIRSAEAGDADAMIKLVDYYALGLGGKVNYPQAVGWCRKAVQLNHPPAMGRMGNLSQRVPLLTGDGGNYSQWYLRGVELGDPISMMDVSDMARSGRTIKQDLKKSRDLSERALPLLRVLAETGDPWAVSYLGWSYRDGLGVERDYAEAMKWFRKAAEAGNTDAMCNIGVLYRDGLGVERDYAEVMKWYRKAAEAGDTDALCGIGLLYHDGLGVERDYAEAMKWFRKAAEAGNADALCGIGVLYHDGSGVERDYAEAMKWFRKAAELRHPMALFNVGNCYVRGLGVGKDETEGRRWYQRAEETGDGETLVALGNEYAGGESVQKDVERAVRLYRKAAEAGNATAMNQLGTCYANGTGVSKDDQEALRCFRKAAKLGEGNSMAWLGNFYEEGRGVSKDQDEAIKWYRKGAGLGSDFCKERLKKLNVQ
jgi:TPR repeat protein